MTTPLSTRTHVLARSPVGAVAAPPEDAAIDIDIDDADATMAVAKTDNPTPTTSQSQSAKERRPRSPSSSEMQKKRGRSHSRSNSAERHASLVQLLSDAMAQKFDNAEQFINKRFDEQTAQAKLDRAAQEKEHRAENATMLALARSNTAACGRLALRVNATEVKTNKLADDTEDRFERLKRERDITITGVPRSYLGDGANIIGIVKKIAAAVGWNEMRMVEDVEFARKSFETRDGSFMLHVRFATKRARDAMFNGYMRTKNLDTSCLGAGATQRIFVSDNLTKRNAAVRKRALALKKTKDIRQMYIRDGLVSVSLHKDEEGKKHPVSTVDELERLVHPPPAKKRSTDSDRLSSAVGQIELSESDA